MCGISKASDYYNYRRIIDVPFAKYSGHSEPVLKTIYLVKVKDILNPKSLHFFQICPKKITKLRLSQLWH